MKKIGVVGIPDGWSSERLADTVEKKTGSRYLFDMDKISADIYNNKVFYEDIELNDFSALIIKKVGLVYSPDLLDRLEILRFLSEKIGVKMFSSPNSIIRLLDRLSCTMTLRIGGIPMPETVITEDINAGVQAVKKFGKAVFKPLFTSKARGMTIIEDNNETKDKIEEYKGNGNPVMYIQKMLEHPGKDLGVSFLGGKYLATYARVGSKDSWNTTINSGGKYQPYEPSQEIIDLAYKAQSLFNLDFTCVDVVETSDGPLIFEVSAFGGFRGLLDANNIDAAELYVDYVMESIK